MDWNGGLSGLRRRWSLDTGKVCVGGRRALCRLCLSAALDWCWGSVLAGPRLPELTCLADGSLLSWPPAALGCFQSRGRALPNGEMRFASKVVRVGNQQFGVALKWGAGCGPRKPASFLGKEKKEEFRCADGMGWQSFTNQEYAFHPSAAGQTGCRRFFGRGPGQATDGQGDCNAIVA